VVVARDSHAGPEVLLLKRNAAVAFMASAWVFPGGRVDVADGDPQLARHIEDAEAAFARAVDRPDATRARALLATTVRECLEEAGLLLAVGAPDSLQAALAERAAVQASQMTLHDLLHRYDLRVPVDSIVHFAHWITPPFERRRYDTRFFLARAPEHQTGEHDNGETVESRWMRPADAVAANSAGEITLPPPTLRSLFHLSRASSVDEMFAWARSQTVAPIEPTLCDDNGAMCLVFPGTSATPGRLRGRGAAQSDHGRRPLGSARRRLSPLSARTSSARCPDSA
jgi:8-oxo-dGTP pyrophosphatase MutT (NUDIX family)